MFYAFINVQLYIEVYIWRKRIEFELRSSSNAVVDRVGAFLAPATLCVRTEWNERTNERTSSSSSRVLYSTLVAWVTNSWWLAPLSWLLPVPLLCAATKPSTSFLSKHIAYYLPIITLYANHITRKKTRTFYDYYPIHHDNTVFFFIPFFKFFIFYNDFDRWIFTIIESWNKIQLNFF